MQTARQKALKFNTLYGILKACEGKNVQIDLRNEMHVYGQVNCVFSELNITLSNAYLMMPSVNSSYINKSKKFYSEITIRGKNIRFVHIPDDVDMLSSLQKNILNKAKANKNEFKKKPRFSQK